MGDLGWADFQGRRDRAIRRHWHLIWYAFSFCWRAWFEQTEHADDRAVDVSLRTSGKSHPVRPILAAPR